MNYIRRLQSDLASAKAEAASLRRSLADLNWHLHTSKVQGVDSNSDRRDWIATVDVRRWIQEAQHKATLAGERESDMPQDEVELIVLGEEAA